MDYPKLIVSIKKEESISVQRVKQVIAPTTKDFVIEIPWTSIQNLLFTNHMS